MEEMTEQEKYIRSAAAVFKDALAVLNQRSNKYTGPGDPFANFDEAAQIADTDVTQGIMTRFGDKVGRIRRQLAVYRDEQVSGSDRIEFVDESFRDSVIDGINYLTILLIYVETGGGVLFDEFLEQAGLAEEPKQPALPGIEAEENPGWFQKFLK